MGSQVSSIPCKVSTDAYEGDGILLKMGCTVKRVVWEGKGTIKTNDSVYTGDVKENKAHGKGMGSFWMDLLSKEIGWMANPYLCFIFYIENLILHSFISIIL